MQCPSVRWTETLWKDLVTIVPQCELQVTLSLFIKWELWINTTLRSYPGPCISLLLIRQNPGRNCQHIQRKMRLRGKSGDFLVHWIQSHVWHTCFVPKSREQRFFYIDSLKVIYSAVYNACQKYALLLRIYLPTSQNTLD